MPEAANETTSAATGRNSLFQPPYSAIFNHLLRHASWARERLKPHAGKTAQFSIAPFSFGLTILESGEVIDAPRDTPADASFALPPWTALLMLSDPDAASRQVQSSGDTELARDLFFLARNLRWDAEEDLSRVFGDVLAHRMVRTGAALLRWQSDTAQQLGRSAAAYWTEERPLVASRYDIERFVQDVDALRDDVERAEKRLDRLLATLN